MANQRVLVTGGTRGIGFELVRAFSRRGATVALCGRSESGPELRARLGTRPAYYQADLASPSAIEGLASRVREEIGPPTILVNNAGVQFNHVWSETDSLDRWACAQTEVNVNLLAPLGLTALFLNDLIAAPRAAIINLTSILAHAPKESAPVYSATKAALRSFSVGLRCPLSASPHVRIVEVIPPVVDTAMTAGRGSGKMDPGAVAEEIVHGIEKGENEIWIGKARVVRILQRLAPGVARRLLKGA